MIDAQLPGPWKDYVVAFSITNAALAKILADVAPAQVLPAISGEVALPGDATVRQRVLTGGQRIIDGEISSTDGTARSVQIWVGRQTSLYANMGAVTTSGTNVLNRASGSFIADGFVVGDAIMLFGAPTAGNNGVAVVVTAVTATTLTVNGTPFTNETMGAGFRVFRVSLRTRRAVPINAGNADTTPPVVLLGGTQDPAAAAQPDTGWSLDADSALIVAMVAAVSALPAQVMVSAHAALY